MKDRNRIAKTLPFAEIRELRARRLFYYLVRIVYKGRTVLGILFLNIVLGGLLFSLFDGKSIAEGQYLALITALTVGYGDLSPESWPARIVSGFVGLNGLLLTGVIIAFTVKALEYVFREDLERIAEKTASIESEH